MTSLTNQFFIPTGQLCPSEKCRSAYTFLNSLNGMLICEKCGWYNAKANYVTNKKPWLP